jgi:hypothetical protein
VTGKVQFPVRAEYLSWLREKADALAIRLWRDEDTQRIFSQPYSGGKLVEMSADSLHAGGWIRCPLKGHCCHAAANHRAVYSGRIACLRCGTVSHPLTAEVREVLAEGLKL